jgi:hypothetical protein
MCSALEYYLTGRWKPPFSFNDSHNLKGNKMNTNRKCEVCDKAPGIVFKKKMMDDPMNPGKKILIDALCCTACANQGRQMPRKFVTCKGCNSATLATHINPTRGLCKVCEDKAIAVEIDPTVKENQEFAEFHELLNDQRGREHEKMARKSMGVDFDDDEPRDLALTRAERKKLEEDRLYNAEQDRLAKSQDPAQFLMNKARQSVGIDLRDYKAEYTPATDLQLGGLAKLGHNPADLPKMKLTVAEASRLMQRGPKWLWPKKTTVQDVE